MECFCQASKCDKECAATLCDPDKPTQPDATCTTCIQSKTTSCANEIQTACTADADCVAFDACVADSGCLSK